MENVTTSLPVEKSDYMFAKNFLEILRIDRTLENLWFEDEEFWKILVSKSVSYKLVW